MTFVADATGAITARAITVTAATNTKAYDGTTSSSATPTITTGTLATGDIANFTETYDTKNVGTGKTLTASGTVNDGNGGNNYAVTFVTNTTGAITAEAITVTATTNTKAYDGNNHAAAIPTITSGTLAAGDTAHFSETYDTKNAGTGKTLTAGRFHPSPTATAATTMPSPSSDRHHGRDHRPLAITVTAKTNTKGVRRHHEQSRPPTPIHHRNRRLIGDGAHFTETYDTKDVGTGKTLTASGVVTDGNGGKNYVVTFVTPDTTGDDHRHAHITVTAARNTKVFDGNNSAAAIPTITDGQRLATPATTPPSPETYDNKNAGTGKTLTASGTIDDGDNGNDYVITFLTNSTGVITARADDGRDGGDQHQRDRSTFTAPPAGSAAIPTGTVQFFDDTMSARCCHHGRLHRHLRTRKPTTPGTSRHRQDAGPHRRAVFTVNDGNGGNNYAITFVNNTTGVITPRRHHRDGGRQAPRFTTGHHRRRDAAIDDHNGGHARDGRHRRFHRNLRQQKRWHRQDAHRHRHRERRQRRQELRGHLYVDRHDRRHHHPRRSP